MSFSGRVGHLENIESPWADSGGVAKTFQDVELLAKTGVGWIEAGSFTIPARPHKGPHLYDSTTGIMLNAVEMDNCGFDELENIYPEMERVAEAHGKPLLINAATVNDRPAAEAVELVRRGQAMGAHILLNPDCPNVIDRNGRRLPQLSRDPARFAQVLNALVHADLVEPIFLRIAPQETYERMSRVCKMVIRSRVVSALFVSNSWPVAESDIGPAGKSGPAMAEAGYLETKWASEALKGSKVGVVASSGIGNARELRRRLDIGQNVQAGAGTTFFFESQNGWADDTGKLLSDLAA